MILKTRYFDDVIIKIFKYNFKAHNILMKFIYLLYKSPLYFAVEKQDLPIIQLLLSNERINVNIINKIFKLYFNIIQNKKVF